MINSNYFSISFAFIIVLSVMTACNEDRRPAQKGTIKKEKELATDNKLVLKSSIQLPNVKGGFDLMALDIKGKRLFISAEDNHTLEVINLITNLPARSVPGLNEPKWVAYRPERKQLYVATGGDGKVTEFNDSTFQKVRTFDFKEKCNNLRFDADRKHLFVGVGNTFGAIGIIDLNKGKITGQIPLSDYPKQFEIDSNLIYINVPRKNRIEVVDWMTKKHIASWPVIESKENVPMALDRRHKRLFIACEPGKFIVFSTSTGSSVASLDIATGADGVYYDAVRARIYVSCGEGDIEVIQQKSPDQYQLLQKIPTTKGAGTSLFTPELDEFFLAVPQAENRKATIQIYQPEE